jgi:DNA-binding transcriptional ArsR family regulator
MNHMVQYEGAKRLDLVAAAIADPTRRAILARLSRGPTTVSDVAAAFSMTLTGFCKHVRRTLRGRAKVLALSPEPLREVAEWTLQYEKFWNERLDRLQAFFEKEE